MLISPAALGRGNRLFPANYESMFDVREIGGLGGGIVKAVCRSEAA